jgi:uncharacterized protein YneF (UPF0154 family)
MWIPTWLLWLGIGLFLGYWIGIFVAIRRVSRAKDEGRLTLTASKKIDPPVSGGQ